jgi:hypothetical protein
MSLAATSLSGCQTQSIGNGNDEWKKAPPLKMAAKSFDPKSDGFVSHGNYLAVQPPGSPFREVVSELEKRVSGKLQSDSSAQVTVISPAEYEILKTKINMKEIEDIALWLEIQSADLKPVCVGQGLEKVDGLNEQSYFVVLKSDTLTRIRREISSLFIERGGDIDVFMPDQYQPSLPLGFTMAETSASQAAAQSNVLVSKDQNTCRFPLSSSVQ